MFHEVIFLKYGVPRIVISDGGSHFIFSQMSSQAETSNKQIKNTLLKKVNQMGRSWRSKLNEALCAYQMAYKTLIGIMPYQLVYRKTCHLPIELKHKARPSKGGTCTSRRPKRKGNFRLLNMRNGGKRLTTVPSYIKKEPKDGTTRESRSSNSSREIRYFSLTLAFIYFVMVSFIVSGKAST
jgi:hypothetical protein